jgi:Resolvase, N terminal domain
VAGAIKIALYLTVECRADTMSWESLESSETDDIPMPTYGYARVSTIDQDLSLQRRALKAAGCDVIRAEKASGTRRSGRTELEGAATRREALRPQAPFPSEPQMKLSKE